jgi:hypothetical protein
MYYIKEGRCRGSLTASSKFLRLRIGPRTVAQMGVHRIYTRLDLRRVTPYIQFMLLYYLHWFVVGVTNGRERELGPMSL